MKCYEHWQYTCGQRQPKEFLKRPSAKSASELFNWSQNQLRILMGPLTGHHHLNEHIFRLQLLGNPRCGRCQQAYATASHVLCDCEALATIRFRHLGQHFVKPGDFHDISNYMILHFVQSVGCWMQEGYTKKIDNIWSALFTTMPPNVFYSTLFYSILFYSIPAVWNHSVSSIQVGSSKNSRIIMGDYQQTTNHTLNFIQ